LQEQWGGNAQILKRGTSGRGIQTRTIEDKKIAPPKEY